MGGLYLPIGTKNTKTQFMATKEELLKEAEELGLDIHPDTHVLTIIKKIKEAKAENRHIEDLPQNTLDNRAESIEERMLKREKEFADTIEQFRAELKRMSQEKGIAPSQQNVTVNLPSDVPFGERVDDNDLKDFDEKPTVYIMAGRGFVFSTYNSKGKEVKAPFNEPIVFKPMALQPKPSGDAHRFLYLCSYKTHSKKEKRWIENSPQYGTVILTFNDANLNKAFSMNPDIGNKLETITNAISQLNSTQIIAKANSMGIDIAMPVDEIKRAIAMKEAQRFIDDEMRKQEQMITMMNEHNIRQAQVV